MVDIFLNISIVLLYISACFSGWSKVSYLKYLKIHYTDSWKDLGCPEHNVYLNRVVNEAVNRFEKNKEYLKFNDPVLTKKVYIYKICNSVLYGFLGCCVVLVILHYCKISK